MPRRIEPVRSLPLLLLVLAVAWALAQNDAQDEMSDEARATQYFEEITAAPYTAWPFEPNVPEGYYVGVEPHGMILRTFINEIAAQDVADGTVPEGGFSEGAIIVKENHMPGDVDISGLAPQAPVPEFSGNLAALTFMVKLPGYNPEAGDWFWAKMQPDGTIDAAGKPQGCIACHGQVKNQDYVFNVRASE